MTELPTNELPTTELPTTELPTTELPTTELPTTCCKALFEQLVATQRTRAFLIFCVYYHIRKNPEV